ncbi:hypothetical protein HDU87_005443 [Geranomyces variabilis]|uniref:SH3 domain-containing protein n=1 Tax=Geranomyces variabilis TaxID=109894 RepID=A0AAD5TJG0_9FUNG|nr:hypothetical protein HDU87_005443 [Geranomyces variabilis]
MTLFNPSALQLLTLAAAAAAAAASTAAAQRPAECIAIDATTACAPFGIGHYVNATQLGHVYGLSGPLPSAAYWDDLVRQVTSRGDKQKDMWKNWAQCTGYQGEPIQYYRTYTCMTDVYVFSAGCNVKTPDVPICESACDAYGSAVKLLVSDTEVCPASDNKMVNDRRNYALAGAKSCKGVMTAWNGKDNYTPDPQTCSVGVWDDDTSCGFGGDVDTAAMFCTQVPNDPCCLRRRRQQQQTPQTTGDAKPPPAAPKNDAPAAPGKSAGGPAALAATQPQAAGDILASEAINGSESSSNDESFWSKNKTAIIAGTASVAAVLVAIAVVGTLYLRKARATSQNINARLRSKGMHATSGEGAVPFLASTSSAAPPQMKSVEAASKEGLNAKHRVVYDYEPQLVDELELAKGDSVEVFASFDDGWGKGTNIRTGKVGTFPMACVELKSFEK